MLSRKGHKRMTQDEESLALALRGGLRGRFQSSFNQLDNALEVLEDYIQQRLNPAEEAELRPLFRQAAGQLAYLRRLSDHAADAAAAPLLQSIRAPHPLELISHLQETADLFNELTAGSARPIHVQLKTASGLDLLPTMGEPALLDSLLANLFTNSIQAVPQGEVQIALSCAPGCFTYRDNGPGLSDDARCLLLEGTWSEELLARGGLGLPLIRAYCDAMGWQIRCTEDPAALVFTLPPCRSDDPLAALSSPVQDASRRRRQLFLRELQGILPDASEP